MARDTARALNIGEAGAPRIDYPTPNLSAKGGGPFILHKVMVLAGDGVHPHSHARQAVYPRAALPVPIAYAYLFIFQGRG